MRAPHLFPLVTAAVLSTGCHDATSPAGPSTVSIRTRPAEALFVRRWDAVAPIPNGRLDHQVGVATDAAGHQILYAFGGLELVTGKSTPVRAVDAYNALTDTWSPRASTDFAQSNVNGVGRIGSKFYLAGGARYTADGLQSTATLAVYNWRRDTWSRKADMPVSGSHGVAGVIGGKLYVLVGLEDTDDPECPACSRPVRSFFRYDPSTDRWERLPDCPNNHTKGAAGVIDGKLYVAGGAGPGGDAGGSNSHLDIYDPATNRWTTGAPMPAPGLGLTGAVIGRGLYVLGGERAEMRFYNSKTDRWTMRPSLLTPRTFPAMARVVVNGQARLVAVGGHTETGTETEIYMP